jgi:hypothetical protein
MLEIHAPHDDVRVIAVAGDIPMTVARGLVVEAMRSLQDEGIKRLAIDVTAATGLGAPHVATRLDVVREWAAAARPGLALAFVGPESIMDAQRVGLVVARGSGMIIDVFHSRADAVDWLRAQPGLTGR